MKSLRKLIFISVLVPLISSCSQSLKDYQAMSPKLDLKTYFDGQLIAHGMLQDYSDTVTRTFTVDLLAKWEGNKGVLDEIFYFNDGEIDYRCWRLEKTATGYIGTAGDVTGQANGIISGNTLNWQYELNVKTDSGDMALWLDDWLYLIDESTLLNKTEMRKFGINVANITLSISKTHNLPPRELREDCQL